jgi:hypothetical protein
MGTGEIIATGCFLLLLIVLVMRGKSVWKDRKTGTGDDVDLSSLGKIPGYGGAWDPGDPEMITRIEKKLKKQANK